MNLYEQREFLRNNNLEMTKKLDKIIEDAKPKPKTEKRPIIPKRVIIEQDITGTPEYKATKQISDLLLSQTLNDTITGAMNSITGKKSENENKVSQEVQDDFRAMNPIEVGDQKRLYYDIPIPALPDFIPTPPTTRFTTEEEFDTERERLLTELNNFSERRTIILEDIQVVETQINDKAYVNPIGFAPSIAPFNRAQMATDLKDLTESYDSSGNKVIDIQPLLDIRDGKKIKTTAKTIPGLIRAITDFEERIYKERIKAEEATFVGKKTAGTETYLQSELLRLKNDLKFVEQRIAAIETNIDALNAMHDALLREIEDNEIERNKVENERRLLANDALNTFNRLNQGRIQIQREPQETDEDLLKRIARLGTIQADPSDIQIQILDKAKKHITINTRYN